MNKHSRTRSLGSAALLALALVMAGAPGRLPLLHAIGEAGDTPWPEGARVEVKLRLSHAAASGGGKEEGGSVKGELMITNPTREAVTIQRPSNRGVLAFMVSNALGNPVAPDMIGKADPSFETQSLAGGASQTFDIDGLDFVTGSAYLEYRLKPGETCRVIAIYRPAGPRGPGFTSGEVEIQIPR